MYCSKFVIVSSNVNRIFEVKKFFRDAFVCGACLEKTFVPLKYTFAQGKCHLVVCVKIAKLQLRDVYVKSFDYGTQEFHF